MEKGKNGGCRKRLETGGEREEGKRERRKNEHYAQGMITFNTDRVIQWTCSNAVVCGGGGVGSKFQEQMKKETREKRCKIDKYPETRRID